MASKSKYHKLLRIIYGGLNIDAIVDNDTGENCRSSYMKDG